MQQIQEWNSTKEFVEFAFKAMLTLSCSNIKFCEIKWDTYNEVKKK